MKTFEVQVTATITKWLRVEAEDEDEATDLAYEGFDCQPSVTEKYWQEVDFVREVGQLASLHRQASVTGALVAVS
jgi:hypothetical protein